MTRAQPYGEYKESEVEWLGPIPTQWELRRLKSVVALQTDRAVEQTNPVALENIQGWTGRFLPSDSEFTADGTKFSSGDVLFGKLRPYLAKSWLADCDGEAVGDFHVFRPSLGLSSRFLQYITLSPEFISMVDGSTFGAKMPRASWDFIGELRYPMPDRATQDLVASFLDRETVQIDDLIGKQERLIELMAEKRQAVITQAVTKGLDPNTPTKPSGVPWQGDVPALWTVQPLKNLMQMQTGVTLGKDYTDTETESFAYLRVANVQIGYVDLSHVKEIELPASVARSSLLRSGDVLMTEGGDRDKLARGCIWDGAIDPCVHQNHIFAVRTNHQLLNMFLVLVLDADPARTYFYLTGKQSTNLASTNSTTVKNFRFGVPPIDEQMRIIEHLKIKIDQIDELVDKAQAVVGVLRERRSALISAAVTGKIDVREGVA
ncbi:hypothetical protein [Arthrobacter sp. BF1]|uniref:restriction endonuclease subunit S n=1 Tax=Arthrobacter sp. BF1 TaxID=2821145 RepID=UPI001C500335|nr:hypothetical protein [Arthrobacter sp. BF1]